MPLPSPGATELVPRFDTTVELTTYVDVLRLKIPPPSPSEPLPLTVLLAKVALPMPFPLRVSTGPRAPAPLLPLIVDCETCIAPRLTMPPPPASTAVTALLLTVLRVSVRVPSLWMAPPDRRASLFETVTLSRLSVPRLKIAPPAPKPPTLAQPFWSVRLFRVKSPRVLT